MGKASKWFRSFLGLKNKPEPPSKQTPQQLPPNRTPTPAIQKKTKDKRSWNFVKSHREDEVLHLYGASSGYQLDDGVDPKKHAMAVAAANAVVEDAAVAAAQATAAVVRLTSSGRCGNLSAIIARSFGVRKESAAVKIQSAFRGYLARKALRALKAVVRLQALLRGHIERKRTAAWLQRMQALLRAQERARAARIQTTESSHSSGKSSQYYHPGPATPEKFEHPIRSKSMKHDQSLVLKKNGSKSSGITIFDQDKADVGWNRSELWMDDRSRDQLGPSTRTASKDDEKSDRILEIDTGRPNSTPKRRNLFHSSHHTLASDRNSHSYTTSKESTARQTVPSPSSCEVQSQCPSEFSHEEKNPFYTTDSSPRFLSASSLGGSSRRSPFTPTKSNSSRSYFSSYSHHSNFMSYTESSKAKARSLSAPKQRQVQRSGSTKRYFIHGSGESNQAGRRFLH